MYSVIIFNKIRRSIKNSINPEQIVSTLKWIELFESTFRNKEGANFLRKLAVEELNKLDNLEE